MAKKRVLIFSTAYFPRVGGAEIAIRELTNRIDDFEYDLITALLDKDLPTSEKIGVVSVYRLGIGSPVDKLLLPFWGAYKIFQLTKQNGEYAFFWSMMVTYAGLSAYLFNVLRFWQRVPIILSLQEGDSEEHLTKRHFGLIDLSWCLALTRSNAVTALSNYLARRASRLGYKGEVSIVPNGVDTILFAKQLKQAERNKAREALGYHKGDLVLVHTGRLVAKNAVGDIVKSLAYLPPEVKLLSIGDGELLNSLSDIAKGYNVADRVKFIPKVDYKKLPHYLELGDVFVRPSLSEGLGNSFLEAMSMGLPIIGTNVGGIPDFLSDRETGLVCEPGNALDISDKVKILITNKDLVNEMIKNAKVVVSERYTWDHITKNFLAVTKSI